MPPGGESPVFAEPWQAQAFALVTSLHAAGAFTWSDWTNALGRRLAAAGAQDDGSRYYEHWLAALEDIVADHGLSRREEMADRRDAWERAWRNTPHGRPVELAAGNSD